MRPILIASRAFFCSLIKDIIFLSRPCFVNAKLELGRHDICCWLVVATDAKSEKPANVDRERNEINEFEFGLDWTRTLLVISLKQSKSKAYRKKNTRRASECCCMSVILILFYFILCCFAVGFVWVWGDRGRGRAMMTERLCCALYRMR